MIYLDHNATTRPAPEVRSEVLSWLENWGNPSSIHQAGRGPKSLMRWSRSSIAKMIGADPLELVFTSCGSESNNLAIKGVLSKLKKQGKNHILVSSVEHPSILKTVEFLKKEEGFEYDLIPVSRGGILDIKSLEGLLRPETALVSVMMANNETGSVFPIREISALLRDRKVLFHTDAVQTLGKIPVNVKELGVDLASFSAHKFYALRGCGVLYIRRGTPVESLIHGGGQERNRRAGTENTIAIASLAVMSSRLQELPTRSRQTSSLREFMEKQLLTRLEGVSLTGADGPRLPNTSSLIISGVDGEILLMNLDMEGFCVSTGAACSSGSQEPSQALLAMGLSRQEAQSSLRVSLGWETTETDILKFVEVLVSVVNRLRTIGREYELSATL